MSFRLPSYVSATTGSPHGCMPGFPTCHWRIASRTTPTLWVFVIAIGPSSTPDSCSHVVPVISPLPFSVNHAPNTGSGLALPRGWTTVTPVRIGPFPTTSLPLPEMSVVCPTSTPATSVIASSGPAVPPIGSPRSRSRGFAGAMPCAPIGAATHPPTARRTAARRKRVARRRNDWLALGMGPSVGGILTGRFDRRTDRVNELVDLPFVDDQRGRQRDDVSRHANERAPVEAVDEHVEGPRSRRAGARLHLDASH